MEARKIGNLLFVFHMFSRIWPLNLIKMADFGSSANFYQEKDRDNFISKDYGNLEGLNVLNMTSRGAMSQFQTTDTKLFSLFQEVKLSWSQANEN